MKLLDYFTEIASFSKLKDKIDFVRIEKRTKEWEEGKGFILIESKDEKTYKFMYEGHLYEMTVSKEGSPVKGAWEVDFSADNNPRKIVNLKDTAGLFQRIKVCLEHSGIKKFSFIGIESDKEEKKGTVPQNTSRDKLYMRALSAIGLKVKTTKDGDKYFEVD